MWTMITKIAIENFKGIGNRIELNIGTPTPQDRGSGTFLKPLTLLFGANSGGKSTILHALHYAREVFERLNANADRTISGGDFVDLGGFANLVHDHDLKRTVWLQFDMDDLTVYEDEGMDAVNAYLRIPELLNGKGNSYVHGVHAAVEVGICWNPAKDAPHVSIYRLYLNGELFAEVTSDPQSNRVCISNLVLNGPGLTKISDWDNRCDENGLPSSIPLAEVYTDHDPEETLLSACWPAVRRWFQPNEHPDACQGDAGFVPIPLRGQSCVLPCPNKRVDIEYQRPHNETELTHYRLVRDVATGISDILSQPINLVRDFLTRFHYLGPLRQTPSRSYSPPRNPDPSRWSCGLGAWDELQAGEAELLRAVNGWLGDKDRLDCGYTVRRKEFKQVDVNDPEVKGLLAGPVDAGATERVRLKLQELSTHTRLVICPNDSRVELGPHDVGIGISQVIPVVVTALAGRESLIAIEQPELHLHPRLAANLGDLFIESALGEPKHTVILETHSEHLILRLLRRIRETAAGERPAGHPGLRPDQLAVFWVDRGPNGSTVRELRVDETGEFVDKWPQGFFEERAAELF
jgi:hypothetical protein